MTDKKIAPRLAYVISRDGAALKTWHCPGWPNDRTRARALEHAHTFARDPAAVVLVELHGYTGERFVRLWSDDRVHADGTVTPWRAGAERCDADQASRALLRYTVTYEVPVLPTRTAEKSVTVNALDARHAIRIGYAELARRGIDLGSDPKHYVRRVSGPLEAEG